MAIHHNPGNVDRPEIPKLIEKHHLHYVQKRSDWDFAAQWLWRLFVLVLLIILAVK